MSALFLVLVLQVCCSARAGACGRGPSASIPKAAETVGIDVIRLRYRNVIFGGVFAGLAGAFLTLEIAGVVPAQHDHRPRVHRPGGGHHRPLDADRGVRGGPAVQRRRRRSRWRSGSTRRPASSGRLLLAIPSQLFGALPYIVTIIVLAGFIGRSRRAGGRRPAVLQGGPDLTAEERRSGPRGARPPGGPRPGRAPRRRRDRRAPADRPADRGRRRVVEPGPAVVRRLPVPSWRHGYDCVPINPNETEVLGVAAFPTIAEAVAATGPFDIVDVFRRSRAVRPARRGGRGRRAPRCLWLQLGVVNWEAARIAAGGRPRRRHGPLHRDRAPPARRASRRSRPCPGCDGATVSG